MFDTKKLCSLIFSCIDRLIRVSTPPAFQMWFSLTLSYLGSYCVEPGLKNHLSIKCYVLAHAINHQA